MYPHRGYIISDGKAETVFTCRLLADPAPDAARFVELES